MYLIFHEIRFGVMLPWRRKESLKQAVIDVTKRVCVMDQLAYYELKFCSIFNAEDGNGE